VHFKGDSVFVINWEYQPGVKAYVTKRQPNCKPYASTKTAPDVKTWKTRKAAERFLTLKDREWASKCRIERLDT
jgi:hypothetical protein